MSDRINKTIRRMVEAAEKNNAVERMLVSTQPQGGTAVNLKGSIREKYQRLKKMYKARHPKAVEAVRAYIAYSGLIAKEKRDFGKGSMTFEERMAAIGAGALKPVINQGE